MTIRDVRKSTPVPHHRWILAASLALQPLTAAAEVLFSDNFDDQPDFTSTMHGDGHTIERVTGHIFPDGWDRLYQGTQWSPETGHPDKHASLEILAANADKAYERSMSEVIDQLQYVPERRMYMASPELALADLHRFQRPTVDLVQEAPNATV